MHQNLKETHFFYLKSNQSCLSNHDYYSKQHCHSKTGSCPTSVFCSSRSTIIVLWTLIKSDPLATLLLLTLCPLPLLIFSSSHTQMQYIMQFVIYLHSMALHQIRQHIGIATWLPAWPATWAPITLAPARPLWTVALYVACLPALVADHGLSCTQSHWCWSTVI